MKTDNQSPIFEDGHNILQMSDEEIEVIPNEKKQSRAKVVEYPTKGEFKIRVHIIGVNTYQQYSKGTTWNMHRRYWTM